MRLYKTVIRRVSGYASGSWVFARNSESALDASERKFILSIIHGCSAFCWALAFSSVTHSY
jgi:hypothetical protein